MNEEMKTAMLHETQRIIILKKSRINGPFNVIKPEVGEGSDMERGFDNVFLSVKFPTPGTT